jgi:hypothetical protein
MSPRFVLLSCSVLVLVLACGGPAAQSADDVQTEVITERMPDGSIRKTTITKRRVGATPPPVRPADPYPSDPLVRYNVERINAYRSRKGLAPIVYDATMSTFARAGSEQLARDHTPHAHFAAHIEGAPGFGSRSAENQGDPAGVPPLAPGALENGKKQIDLLLEIMMNEGPGGGHYDNIMNPALRRVGIGLAYVSGRFYLTNDFSD